MAVRIGSRTGTRRPRILMPSGVGMSDEDIDLDRVVVDPEYRRRVIAFLSDAARAEPGIFEELHRHVPPPTESEAL